MVLNRVLNLLYKTNFYLSLIMITSNIFYNYASPK